MKIGYILKYYPKLSETFINEEIFQLMNLGHEVDIYSLIDCDKELKTQKTAFVLSKAKLNSYSNTILGLLKNLFNYPKLILAVPELFFRVNIHQLVKDIRENKPDHLHTHFIWERAELTRYIANKLNIPFTVTCHAKDIYIPNKKRIIRIAESSKKMITISNYNKDLLISHGIPKEKIEVVHCGIDTSEFKYSPSPNNEIINLLCVGRLTEKKGIIHLLEAAKLLMEDKFTKFHIDIIGDGPLYKTFEQFIIKSKLENNVALRGAKIDTEIRQYLSKCDIFVLPCVIAKDGDMDGIPVVLMEAIAVGKPVISTKISGIPELVKNEINGYLINPNNPIALKNKIKEFKTNGKIKLPLEFVSKHEIQKLEKIFQN